MGKEGKEELIWALMVFGGITLGVLALALLAPKIQSPQGEWRRLQPSLVNEERIQWVDWRGRPREIVIHREVKEV